MIAPGEPGHLQKAVPVAALTGYAQRSRAILDALSMLGEAGPKELAEKTGVSYDCVRQLLRKMLERGDIQKVSYGSYVPVHTVHSVHTCND